MQRKPWFDENGYYIYDYLLSFNKTFKDEDGQEHLLYPIRVAIGARGDGKTVDLQDVGLRFFLKKKKWFTWIRLTDPPIDTILKDPFAFIDKVNQDKYKIEAKDIKTDGRNVLWNGKVLAYFGSLSTYHNDKSTKDFSDTSIMIIDEFKREKTEKNTFDIHNAFVNQIETVIRDRKTLTLIGSNSISDASDLLEIFNFEPRKHGLYKLPKIGVIIHFFEPSERSQKKRPYRTGTRIAGSNKSTKNSLENKVDVEKVDIMRPMTAFRKNFIIKFDDRNYFVFGSYYDKIAFRDVTEIQLKASLERDIAPKVLFNGVGMVIYAWHIKHIAKNVLYDADVVKRIKKHLSSGNVAYSNKNVYLQIKKYLTSN